MVNQYSCKFIYAQVLLPYWTVNLCSNGYFCVSSCLPVHKESKNTYVSELQTFVYIMVMLNCFFNGFAFLLERQNYIDISGCTNSTPYALCINEL